MPGWERELQCRLPQRLLIRVRHVRAGPVGQVLQRRRGEVGEDDGAEGRERGPRVAPSEREDRPDDQPDGAEGACVGEREEDVVEDVDPVLDDPALEIVVDAQARVASICFADSISCCGSNGFPMKPCAPRSVASAAASSSTFPLNIRTGIDPTP